MCSVRVDVCSIRVVKRNRASLVRKIEVSAVPVELIRG